VDGIRKWRQLAGFLLALVLLGAGCTGPGGVSPTVAQPTEPPAEGEVVIGKAVVDSVDVLIMESFPVQVSATVRGNMPDGCTEISHSTQSVEEDTIIIELFTQRPADLMCTEALVPYEEQIRVDITALKDGHYTVDVNGVQVELNLAGSGN
jgi:inhibitor of cysteine peptidase